MYNVCMYNVCMYNVCMYVCMYMYLIANDKSDSPTVQDGCMESECLIGDEQDGGRDATTVLCHKVCCVYVWIGGWV